MSFYGLQGKRYLITSIVGTTGYIYLLTLKTDVYIPTLIDAIFLPSEFCQLKLFRKTLYALFIWKNFITELIATVRFHSLHAPKVRIHAFKVRIRSLRCNTLLSLVGWHDFIGDVNWQQSCDCQPVEIYGRRRSLDDTERELSGEKEVAASTSLPPEETRIPNVWPTYCSDIDGINLTIGTKVFNALATSGYQTGSWSWYKVSKMKVPLMAQCI